MSKWGPHSADLPSNDGLFCSVDHRAEDQVTFSQGQWHSKHISWGVVNINYHHEMPLTFFSVDHSTVFYVCCIGGAIWAQVSKISLVTGNKHNRHNPVCQVLMCFPNACSPFSAC